MKRVVSHKPPLTLWRCWWVKGIRHTVVQKESSLGSPACSAPVTGQWDAFTVLLPGVGAGHPARSTPAKDQCGPLIVQDACNLLCLWSLTFRSWFFSPFVLFYFRRHYCFCFVPCLRIQAGSLWDIKTQSTGSKSNTGTSLSPPHVLMKVFSVVYCTGVMCGSAG